MSRETVENYIKDKWCQTGCPAGKWRRCGGVRPLLRIELIIKIDLTGNLLYVNLIKRLYGKNMIQSCNLCHKQRNINIKDGA